MSAAGEGAVTIRALRPQDSRLEVSAIYEESWRWAYRGIVPQTYLDALPAGYWAAFSPARPASAPRASRNTRAWAR